MSQALHAEYYVTPENYLAAERISLTKHDYVGGAVFAWADVTAGHARIAVNILCELATQLGGKRFEPFASQLKVRIEAGGAEFYYYPDVVVDCTGLPGESIFAEQPKVIFEVLSPETERTDRGEKLRNYQTLDSLDVYVLVDQFHVAVTVYRRTANGWIQEFFTEKTDTLDLPTIGCALSLASIYERTRINE
jgi:Uma2 family endonuclease